MIGSEMKFGGWFGQAGAGGPPRYSRFHSASSSLSVDGRSSSAARWNQGPGGPERDARRWDSSPGRRQAAGK